MKNRQEYNQIAAGEFMKLQGQKTFITHEWDELMYRLTNSDNLKLKEIAQALKSSTEQTN